MKTVVQLQRVRTADLTLDVQAMGTVIAARQLAIKSRVAGRVMEVNPKLFPGSLLRKDDLILRLDEEDYKLALERSRNNLKKADMDLRLEQGNQAVAKREYELIREYSSASLKDAPMDLALRKPQLAKARAARDVARTDVRQAELNLSRTVLRTPFNAVVLEKNVTVGTELSPQTAAAVLAGTDEYWVRVTVPRRELVNILLPDAANEPVPVMVQPVPDTDQSQWQGTILRLLPDVDPQGLMARLLISVPNPLEQNSEEKKTATPLLLGSMVRVVLPGKTISSAFAVPRNAVLPDNTVLLADTNDTLEIRAVTVAAMNDEHAFITAGLEDGERLIISPLAAPIAGMDLSLPGSRKAGSKPDWKSDSKTNRKQMRNPGKEKP